MHFCVEKNCICGEKITNIRYAARCAAYNRTEHILSFINYTPPVWHHYQNNLHEQCECLKKKTIYIIALHNAHEIHPSLNAKYSSTIGGSQYHPHQSSFISSLSSSPSVSCPTSSLPPSMMTTRPSITAKSQWDAFLPLSVPVVD